MNIDTNPQTTGLFWRLAIMGFAIFASFFFSASEFAVIRLDRLKLRNETEKGDKRSKILHSFHEDSSRFLSSISIGNTLANLLLSSFVAVTFSEPLARWLNNKFSSTPNYESIEAATTTVVTVLLTYVVLVFGEITPKQFAICKGEKFSRMFAKILHGWIILVSPIVFCVTATTKLLLHIFGIKPENVQDVDVNEEQIRMQVVYGEEHGIIEQDEKEMIENVFEFNNTVASEIMVHRKDIVALPIDASESECENIIKTSAFSRVPVFEDNIDNIKGILNVRDFLVKSLDQEHVDFSKMLRKPLFVPESIRADVLFSQMQKNKFSMAIVLDEYGGTSGIVTMEDLLEEIVGEIYDEYDAPEDNSSIQKISENVFRIPGDMPLEDVIEELGLPESTDEDDFNTFGGLVFDRIKTVPNVGTIVMLPKFNLEAKVEKMDGNRIDSVIIRKLSEEEISKLNEE